MAKTTDKQKLQNVQTQLLSELEGKFEAAIAALKLQHIQPSDVHAILVSGRFAVQLLRETVDISDTKTPDTKTERASILKAVSNT